MASHLRTALAVPAILALLAGAPAGAVELAQNAPVTTPPNILPPPEAVLPDLWAPAWQVTVTCVGNSVTATFLVHFGNRTKVAVDLSRLPSRGLVTARVEPGQYLKAFDGSLEQVVVSPGPTPPMLKGLGFANVTVKLTNIPRYKTSIPIILFTVIADPDNLVTEAREDNNMFTKQANTSCPPSK